MLASGRSSAVAVPQETERMRERPLAKRRNVGQVRRILRFFRASRGHAGASTSPAVRQGSVWRPESRELGHAHNFAFPRCASLEGEATPPVYLFPGRIHGARYRAKPRRRANTVEFPLELTLRKVRKPLA
jgi:hypothetical protein